MLSQGNRRGIHQFQSGKLAFNVRIADHTETIMAVDAAEVGKHWLLVQSLQKCWRFVHGRPKLMRWKTMRQIPATSPESDAFSKELKHRRFSFVGSTVVYAYMQAVNGKWSPPGLFRLSGDPRREEWETKILPELRKFPIKSSFRSSPHKVDQ